MFVFFQDPLLERTNVYANTNGYFMILSCPYHCFYLFSASNVARIYSQSGYSLSD